MRNRLLNRQGQEPPSPSGFTGAQTVGTSTPTGSVLVDPSAPTINVPPPPLAASLTLVSTLPPSSSTPSATASASSASSSSQIALGTVIAVCIGAFVGLGLLLYAFWWWYRKSTPKARVRARNGSTADLRNARGEVEKRRTRGRSWNKLGDEEDTWKGGVPTPERKQSQAEIDEKNFPMFKKTPSMRTVRTAKELEAHGFDLPPFDFTNYHPKLAEELSLQEPQKPFSRQESGISWDGETVGDDSFLSLRSGRVDSGTMSPTIELAKMTPPATHNAIHTWHSAEVVTVEEVDEPPYSTANPFFNAQEISRATSKRNRSRSNSRSGRSRATSVSSRTSHAPSHHAPNHVTNTNPFADSEEVIIPTFKAHVQSDSIGSTSSGGHGFASEHAMKSLIAALDLTQEEVEERLRVASMQPSTISRYSGISHITGMTEEEDLSTLSTLRTFPIPPTP